MSWVGGYVVGLASGSPGGGAPAADPTVTVSAWSDLGGLTVPDGYLCAVTGESGITRAIVQWIDASSRWDVVDVVCTYAAHAAAEWAATAGEWYSSGGVTVRTADGARVVDTTYGVSWRWSSTASGMVPADVYGGTVAVSAQPIKGDSAEPTGWVVIDTDAGGTASVTPDGTRVTLSASSAGAGTTQAALQSETDSSLSSAGNAYARALLSIPTPTNSGAGYAVAWAQLSDGTDGWDYATAANTTGPVTVTGQWMDAPSSLTYAAQAAISGSITSETLWEFRKVGATVAVRVGGAAGQWQALASATARASAAKLWQFSSNVSRSFGTSTSSLTVRHGRFLRW